MTATDIISCIVGIISLLISVSAIIISCNTARKQTKLSLFNKRYDFYVACDIICGCCLIGMPDAITTRFQAFGIELDHYAFEGSRFLFDRETSDLICSIYTKGMAFRDIAYYLSQAENGEVEKDATVYDRCVLEKEDTLRFLKNARVQLDAKFKKYLHV